MTLVALSTRPSIPRAAAWIVGAAALVTAAGCRTTSAPTAAPTAVTTTEDANAYARMRADLATARAPSASDIAACAALERMAHATPAAVIEPRFDFHEHTPAPVATPARLPHLRYTFESQSEAALDTYLAQWRDNVVPRTTDEIAALDAVEQAVYGAYAAFKFGPDAPRFQPEYFGIDPGTDAMPTQPPPDAYIVLPTVVQVGCTERLSSGVSGQFNVDSAREAGGVRVYLADFRPPSPDPSHTLYLTEEEALTIHHYLGDDYARDPPLGVIDVEPLLYPLASTRYEWLRRRLPIERTMAGGYQLPTLPDPTLIVLDAGLTRAVIDYRDGPSTGGSIGLANDGQGWRVTAPTLGGWME